MRSAECPRPKINSIVSETMQPRGRSVWSLHITDEVLSRGSRPGENRPDLVYSPTPGRRFDFSQEITNQFYVPSQPVLRIQHPSFNNVYASRNRHFPPLHLFWIRHSAGAAWRPQKSRS